MAIMFSKDADGWHIDDTTDPTRSRTYKTEHEFKRASLVLLLQAGERLEAGLASLAASYDHAPKANTETTAATAA